MNFITFLAVVLFCFHSFAFATVVETGTNARREIVSATNKNNSIISTSTRQGQELHFQITNTQQLSDKFTLYTASGTLDSVTKGDNIVLEAYCPSRMTVVSVSCGYVHCSFNSAQLQSGSLARCTYHASVCTWGSSFNTNLKFMCHG